jgi:hypothetical protein
MLDLACATAETFAPLVGRRFRLVAPPANLDLELREIARLEAGAAGDRFRSPFVLFFAGPPGRPLPQHIYRLENDDLGPIDVFLVPCAPDATGTRYQAAFN